jgi:hypothetical protein
VTYQLERYEDPNRYKGRSGRPLFVLRRYLRGPHPTIPKNYDQPVRDASDTEIEDEELVHFVTTFNIEYYASNGRFSQLDPSPCKPADPLGDGQGSNDGAGSGLRIPYLRITISIVDDAAERQERAITRVMWIPTGN